MLEFRNNRQIFLDRKLESFYDIVTLEKVFFQERENRFLSLHWESSSLEVFIGRALHHPRHFEPRARH
jgi:hypothetical protein